MTDSKKTADLTPRERDFLFYGDVDQKSVGKLTKDVLIVLNHDALIKRNDRCYKAEPLRIYIDSYGGDAFACMGLVSVIEASQTPIHTIATGSAMSAAFLMLVSGHTRFCYPQSTTMIHQLSFDFEGDLETAKQEFKANSKLQQQMTKIVTRRTNIPAAKMKQINSSKIDWYMNAQESKKNGVVDIILHKHDDLFLYA